MRLSALALAMLTVAACASHGDQDRSPGQTSFVSAPPSGMSNGGAGGVDGASGGAGGGSAPGTNSPPTANPTSQRTVEETDLYRLEGNRLYYLNGYRGLHGVRRQRTSTSRS